MTTTDERLAILETKLEHTATKESVAVVQGKIDTNHTFVVTRLEALQKSLDARTKREGGAGAVAGGFFGGLIAALANFFGAGN